MIKTAFRFTIVLFATFFVVDHANSQDTPLQQLQTIMESNPGDTPLRQAKHEEFLATLSKTEVIGMARELYALQGNEWVPDLTLRSFRVYLGPYLSNRNPSIDEAIDELQDRTRPAPWRFLWLDVARHTYSALDSSERQSINSRLVDVLWSMIRDVSLTHPVGLRAVNTLTSIYLSDMAAHIAQLPQAKDSLESGVPTETLLNAEPTNESLQSLTQAHQDIFLLGNSFIEALQGNYCTDEVSRGLVGVIGKCARLSKQFNPVAKSGLLQSFTMPGERSLTVRVSIAIVLHADWKEESILPDLQAMAPTDDERLEKSDIRRLIRAIMLAKYKRGEVGIETSDPLR